MKRKILVALACSECLPLDGPEDITSIPLENDHISLACDLHGIVEFGGRNKDYLLERGILLGISHPDLP